MIWIPYTYLIGWAKLDRWYYGVEFKKTAHPDNLWKTYFTSSGIVKYARAFWGEPDVIEVRRTFDSKEKALDWEDKVLVRIKAIGSKRWLNQNSSGKNFHIFWYGKSRKGIGGRKKGSPSWSSGGKTYCGVFGEEKWAVLRKRLCIIRKGKQHSTPKLNLQKVNEIRCLYNTKPEIKKEIILNSVKITQRRLLETNMQYDNLISKNGKLLTYPVLFSKQYASFYGVCEGHIFAIIQNLSWGPNVKFK